MALRAETDVEALAGQFEFDDSPRTEIAPWDEDLIGVYLQDIGTVPLLTAEQEIELGRRIDAGKSARRRLEQKPSEAQRAELLLLIQQGEEARRQMIESNLRLVVSIARRYSGRGMALSDLIEEGNIGLMRAAEKYDYRKGFRFSTYATWWIRQAIIRAISCQSRVVRLPVHVSEIMSQMSKASHRLTQELGREPTSAEIATEVHMEPERVREILRACQQMISLEHQYDGDGDSTVAEMVEDSSSDSPAEQASRRVLQEQVHSALKELSARERDVILMRYGLLDGRNHTLEEIGKALGLTRERIRQIEKEAIERLRNLERSESLRAFMA